MPVGESVHPCPLYQPKRACLSISQPDNAAADLRLSYHKSHISLPCFTGHDYTMILQCVCVLDSFRYYDSSRVTNLLLQSLMVSNRAD